ncbi:MAG: MEKHLA domain-containing protein [Alphaproteobacteria bacterium]|nr:MEKHLA domain-containing protein [Alphaproteobacteria bacterium]
MQTGPILPPPGAGNDWHDAHVRRLLDAFTRATGRDLAKELGASADLGRFFHDGDFALLSHRGDADATLNYGNARALALWECGWEDFTAMPSRQTAPRPDRAERETMMTQVAQKGFVEGYSGERISRGGRRFMIRDGIVWRLQDADGASFGVAAFVPRFDYL